jgi:uncharacterized heparinase superfamily protein
MRVQSKRDSHKLVVRSEMLTRVPLYLRTLAHLRPRQVAYLFLRRIIRARVRVRGAVEMRLRASIRMDPAIPCVTDASENEFVFLKRSKPFKPGCVDWASREMPKLWRYNLHYFDYLHDPNRSRESISSLIADWVAHSRPGGEDAWEPYTVSLRIVNWIKLFVQPGFKDVRQADWLDSLYQQALWLEGNIEYHILANHYLKNGKALFFAGMFFDGDDADRWLAHGLTILTEQAEEQILADGGHYERSPMYHSLVTEDYLDVINLIRANGGIVSAPTAHFLESRVVAMLEFLNDVCLPGDRIPLFNDSAYGVAPAPQEIFAYAGRILGYRRPAKAYGLSVIPKESSGYYVMRDGTDMLVVDCGQIGPDYQPGHGHCDMLSYELVIAGQRVVVDSGVHDYEDTPMRLYARSTKGHNTVAVDEEEQSEIWGVFRVGRRARPIHVMLEKVGECNARFAGSHDGFRRLPGRLIHRRIIDYDVASGWEIRDEIQGEGVHRMESFIHLHPELVASVDGSVARVANANGRCVATIVAANQVEIAVDTGWHFPEFGQRLANVVLKLSCAGSLPLQSAYHIMRAEVA